MPPNLTCEGAGGTTPSSPLQPLFKPVHRINATGFARMYGNAILSESWASPFFWPDRFKQHILMSGVSDQPFPKTPCASQNARGLRR